MYVQRPDLEDMLISALRGKLHIVIQGDSGTGKSWLYKKVLGAEKAHYVIANLANASRLGTIGAELRNLLDREGSAVKTGYEEEKAAGVNAVVASGGVKNTGKYLIGQMEPFEACLTLLRKCAGESPGVLVFDNLEAAFTPSLLKELADLLILCDDERYAIHRVHILIVGVTKGIKEYYYTTPHHSTIANRLYELTEVSRLNNDQAQELLKRGLIDQLKFEIADFAKVAGHVAWVTDRVPQMLHEYGLEISTLALKSEGRIDLPMLETADAAWMRRSLTHPYAVIEHHMNERDTKTGRRNQALYTLGRVDTEYFKTQEIEARLRKAFPISTKDTTLNVPQMLAFFCQGDRPLLRRSPKGDAYTFVDPRYRMVLRAMLVLAPNEERLVKRGLRR
jgi:DNA replicative helicase MCM subunit Mcm2 (Cdc46/Mcm family)